MQHSVLPATPKYSLIVDEFRQQLSMGQLRPGDRMPSYAEMRELSGVSRPTMEKAYSILEREGLIGREPGRGTFVADVRQVERHGVIGVLGLSKGGTLHPYFSEILAGIHQAAAESGAQIMILDNAADVHWEKIDGCISLAPCPLPGSDSGTLSPGMPHVLLLTRRDDAAFVAADDWGGARAATEHLVALGHRRIGYLLSSVSYDLGPQLTHPLSLERIRGYRDALANAGIVFEERWQREMGRAAAGAEYVDRGRDAMNEWLKDSWDLCGCTALLVQNDDAAMGVIQALAAAGIGVPGDVSVVGFDGTRVGRFFSPPLTTVEVPLNEMSVQATQILLRQIKRQQDSTVLIMEKMVLPARLVARSSTGPLNSGGTQF